MKLTETPDFVTWPETHYVFMERTGNIPTNAPLAWQDFIQQVAAVKASNNVTGFLSLYKMKPELYRAGASVTMKPAVLPANLRYELFPGGRYARFVLTGPYLNLGPATGRVIEIMAEKKIAMRDAFHIENYLNDPQNTPEEELLTEILFPVA